MNRLIVHVDMDAFFASVEQRDNPPYRNKPLIVGADPRSGRGRGVVCAASYEARVFGVRSAMPISTAYKLCPQGIYVQPDSTRYSESSEMVMRVLAGFSPVMEQISIDEAFLDCTGTERLLGSPHDIGRKIKCAIKDETGLTASVGIAGNKSVAKIASDLDKPDGLTICEPGGEKEFIAPLPAGRLWGAGKQTVDILKKMGLTTIGDVAGTPEKYLEGWLGKWGYSLWLLANGIDDRPVEGDWVRKSYSEETTFEEDTSDYGVIEHAFLEIADSLSHRLRMDQMTCKTITLKIRLTGFETHTRSITLSGPVDDTASLLRAAMDRFHEFDRHGKKIRLIGISVGNIIPSASRGDVQLDLFSGICQNASGKASRATDTVLDDMKKRFGTKVTRATLLSKPMK